MGPASPRYLNWWQWCYLRTKVSWKGCLPVFWNCWKSILKKIRHQTVDESTWHFTHPFCASGPCERCLKQLVCKIHQIDHDWKIPRESFFFWPVFAMPKTDIRSCVAKTCRYMEFGLGVCRSCDRSRKSSLWWAWVFFFFLKYKLQKPN